MSTDKYEITLFNHINFYISYEIYNHYNKNNIDIKISDILNKAEENMGINQNLSDFYEFINPGNIFSLLYTHLVIPKELFKNEKQGKDFFVNFDIKIEDYFTIKKGREFLDSNFIFLRKLRNIISHAHFNWEDNRHDIKLWDEWKGKVNFEIETDLNKLTNFSLKLSAYLSQNQNKLQF